MAYTNKVLVRAENNEFILQQAKSFSRFCEVYALHRKTNDIVHIGKVDNRTGIETWYEDVNKFKQSTIDKVKHEVNWIYEWTRNNQTIK